MGGMYVLPCSCAKCSGVPDPDRHLTIPAGSAFLVQGQLAGTRDPALRFPVNAWEPDFYGLAVFADFAGKTWQDDIRLDPPPANDSVQADAEINELLALAQNERAARLAEIIEQECDFPDLFLRFLMIAPDSYPMTFNLMKVAARVTEMLMAHFKFQFQRARPQQLEPRLMPPVSGRHHASYPSGHAMMSHMMAVCLAEAAPQHLRPGLLALADRIARNREVAGVHYPSDSAAGKSVADQALKVLQQCDRYRALLAAAKREWG